MIKYMYVYTYYLVYIVCIYIYMLQGWNFRSLLAAELEPFQRISILQECCYSVHTMHMYVS